LAELITVDGRYLSGEDRFGDWKVTSLEGWWDTPDRKGRDVEIELADGSYDLEEAYEQRLVTIEGRVKSKNHDMQHEAMNWLNGALSRSSGEIVVAGHGQTQHARVKLAGSTRWTTVTDRYAKFQMRLKCPDPRKFGEVRTFVARVNAPAGIQHFGNYPATPFMRVTGNAPGGYRITLGGYSVQVNRELGSSYPHEIDYWTGRLRVNDKFVTGDMSSAVFAPVDPGQRDTLSIVALTSGSPVVTMTLPDTFI